MVPRVMNVVCEEIHGFLNIGLYWCSRKVYRLWYLDALDMVLRISSSWLQGLPQQLVWDYISLEPAGDFSRSCDIVAFYKI